MATTMRPAASGTGSTHTALPRPVPAPHRQPAQALLAMARHGLFEAACLDRAVERYAAAHLAALRAAAAVLAARAHPDERRRGRPTSAWVLLAEVAPELAEWAAFFSAGAAKRAAAEAGLTRVVSIRDADDLVRDAQLFLTVVSDRLGLDQQLPLDVGQRSGRPEVPDQQDLSRYDSMGRVGGAGRHADRAVDRPVRIG